MPQPQITSEQLAPMLETTYALLKGGTTPAAIHKQWIETGASPQVADLLISLAQSHEQTVKKASRRINALVYLGPVALIAAIVGVVVLVQALQGPSGFEVVSPIAQATCGERTAQVVELDGQIIMTAGDGLSVPGSLRHYDDDFKDLMLDGDAVKADVILCAETHWQSSKTCDGYFSQEVIDAIESSDTFEEVQSALLQYPDPEGIMFLDELMSGGRSVRVEGSTLTVRLVDIETSRELDSTRVTVPADCPDLHTSSTYSIGQDVHRRSPGPEHTARAIRALLDIEI